MNNKIIKFEIVTPEKEVLKENIKQISVPTKNGEITILPNHIPLVAGLAPGVIEVVKENDEIEIISLSGGFIEVLRTKVVILADTAEMAYELDIKEIEKAKKRAEETLKEVRSFDQERFANISAALAKELARTKALKRWKNIKSLNK
jgi:F-type H+-transporting ATPase subunit epsilon